MLHGVHPGSAPVTEKLPASQVGAVSSSKIQILSNVKPVRYS